MDLLPDLHVEQARVKICNNNVVERHWKSRRKVYVNPSYATPREEYLFLWDVTPTELAAAGLIEPSECVERATRS